MIRIHIHKLREIVFKKKYIITIYIFVILYVISQINTVSAQITNVNINPQQINASHLKLDQVYNLSIVVQDILDLDSYELDLIYNHSKLELVGIEEGPYLAQHGSTVFYYQQDQNIHETTIHIYGKKVFLEKINGSGIIASLFFKIKIAEPSSVEFTNSLLLNSENDVIAHINNGSDFLIIFELINPQAHFLTGSNWYNIGDNIILDGSVSTKGYDPLPEECFIFNEIIDYNWEIDYNNDGTIDESYRTETIQLNVDNPGIVNITLTIFAPDYTQPTSPEYKEYDSTSHIINITSFKTNPVLDVFTDRGGIGPQQNATNFGPKELVTVYGYVTYNSAPIVNKDVVFYTFDNYGNIISARTIRTNIMGIAEFSFRIPWPYIDPQSLFGTWSITGVVDVAENIIHDSVSFNYGYLTGVPLIDLYTDRGGIGYAVNSDVYGPQELVMLYANVTYNGAPIVGKLVLFEIFDNEGNLMSIRTSTTGNNGIAISSFRIPWPDVEPESLFGEWRINANVDVAEMTASDYLTFSFNYLVEIVDVWSSSSYGGPQNFFYRNYEVYLNIEYVNNREKSMPVVVSNTMLDTLYVPINSGYMLTILPTLSQNTITVKYVIPSWTYVGKSHVYTSILNYKPGGLGIPYCPENYFYIYINQLI